MTSSSPPPTGSRPRPKYSPVQVRRRQVAAGGCLLLVILLVVVSCTALLGRDGKGGSDAGRGGGSGDAELAVSETPSDAPALSQLPGKGTLGQEENLGIDVSAHQEEIDWEKVRGDGVGFAYIKATEGAGYTDPRLNANWRGARQNGVTPGAYHYFTLCSPGAEQAEEFLRAVPPSDDALPPALDLEFDGACENRPEVKEADAQVDAFLEKVEEAWGRPVLLYSSVDWRNHYGLGATEDRPDWLFQDGKRPAQGDWALWQVRFDGSVAGIDGDVDIDVLRLDVLQASGAE
ncbi:lysozyme [Brachybacterium endophyticum]|uniref:Lysozyme n=1 Tax=Brachybacterium endophyticum TaxID=2182385 RepID=A0A2U2RN54_9MICO|nr:GH25 family lysozyme [Brachybacterium endophyticum]PWH07302.1 lysozyme [Brachybacterium endophyticum]